MVSRFSLVPDGEHQDGVLLRLIGVERDIPCSSLRNHELTQPGFSLPANQRMTNQDGSGLIDQVECLQRILTAFGKKIADTFEVGKRLARIDYFRHGLASGLSV